MNEELVSTVAKSAEKKHTSNNPYSAPLKLSGITTTDEFRYKTGIGELDNVLGGGIVKGSLVQIN